MFKRVSWFASAALAASPALGQSAPATPPPTAEAAVDVPRQVLARYVGRYDMGGPVLAVTLGEEGRLTAVVTGQPPVPLRAISASEFAIDALGARLLFEGEGPLAPRVRSRFAGNEAVGTRIPEGASALLLGSAPGAAVLDGPARREAVASLAKALRDTYVFPDIGERAAARIEAADAAGEYDSLSDPGALAARLRADLEAIAHDKHLTVGALGAPMPPPPGMGQALPRSEAGVVRADRLPGGIGYIELIAFPQRSNFEPVIARAMAALADSRALIIDLRRNMGGAPEGVAYLVSFLLPAGEPVHINDIVTRVAGTSEITRESFFSQPTPTRFDDRPVYVLTSSRTFSGGEEFAYDVKALGKAVIVGERTGGGGNPAAPAALGHGLVATIPLARAENPITKDNWEGRGVEPDILAPAQDALQVALKQLGLDEASDIAAASTQQVFAPRTVPLARSEPALRALLAGVLQDPPNLAAMSPQQAEMLRPQLPQVRAHLGSLGELRSIRFREPGLPAGDSFDVTFTAATLGMTVMLGPDGRLIGWRMEPRSPGG